jgi:pimeloyl-ACP methyl ester carboxylesterase
LRNARPIAVASGDISCGGVVLLHGIAMGSWTLKKLERALQRRGFATLNLDYASRKKPLEQLAEDIHAPIQAFASRLDGPIHFVGHSMGGLLARTYVAKHRPDRLGRVVLLGTPNGGIVAGNRSLYPISSLFILPRPNDGRVSVDSAKLADMADHTIIRATHAGLTRHPSAIDQTIAFLSAGRFGSSYPTARTH